jgi:hypothetical protein
MPRGFGQWLHAPMLEESLDPRFEVRRARPEFHRAGFLERPSTPYLYLRVGKAEQPRLDEWQLLPGDHDDL